MEDTVIAYSISNNCIEKGIVSHPKFPQKDWKTLPVG
jgi:hypothetical protein